ncbi:DUF4158 domain-containing protein [Streptomyces hydrogenans]|uniref:DUF4158 domain-containing protein n=1 Tax=Streptomyces hydrogenans TaxID=1873719 RepID=UPI00380F0A68
MAGQFGTEDMSCAKRYAERRRTPYEHARETQKRLRYRHFGDRKWGREFRGFLYGRAWTHAEGPVALFDHAVTWLRRHRVLLPGVPVPAGRCRRPAQRPSGACTSRWHGPRAVWTRSLRRR